MKLLQAGILTISVMLSVTMIASSQDMFSKKQPSLKLGEKLPDLEVTTQNGKQVKLEAAKGHRWVFVFFYPKALTGGWTKQVCAVQDVFAKLTENKVSVFGVSTDKVETQLKFRKKEKLNYTLVADTDKKVTKAFKVPLFMSKMASRQAYLFKDGVLVWRDVKGATKTQGEDVLEAIKKNADWFDTT